VHGLPPPARRQVPLKPVRRDVMAAGASDLLWSMEDVAALVDARAPKPGRREPQKKRAASASGLDSNLRHRPV
jgi:hypothetical protein